MTDKPSFASRWSDRKRAVQEEAEIPLENPVAETPAVEDQRSDEEILSELGLKDPEDMVKGDDFSAFLKSEIPKHLRKRALRKLWTSNPVLANVDGLNDYDGDYTIKPSPLGGIKSAYEVGKGYAAKLQREAEEAEAEAALEEAAALENAALDSDDSADDVTLSQSIETEPDEIEEDIDQTVINTTEGSEPELDAVQLEGEPVFPRRKRMSFEFQ